MRVGVTGSSGLIGTALVGALRERGDEVVRFVRPSSKGVDGRDVRWDPAKGAVDESDLRRVGALDAVVNLAGAGIGDRRWSLARKREILDSRINSTTLVVKALQHTSTGPTLLINSSAVGIYGSRGDEVLDEDSSLGTDFLADVCRRWEQAAAAASDAGARVAYLRNGIVMSRRGGALKKQLPLFRLGVGGRLADGRQWVSPISLIDEIRAILWIIDHRLEGPFNLVAPTPMTNRDFTAVLGRTLHRPTLATVPEFALRAALGRELVTLAVLASQRTVPTGLLESGFRFEHPDGPSILRAALA